MQLAPHPFTLRQLQYVVAVADSLSFRKAAARCHVSQPSLSAQLALLEESLGVRLFERDRRRVLLTSAGEKLVERARRLLLEADDLLEESRRVGDPLAGTLRVGVIPTVSPYLLPAVAPALRRRFPRLTLAWVEEKTEVLVRDLDAGALDAALVALEADVGDVEKTAPAIHAPPSRMDSEEATRGTCRLKAADIRRPLEKAAMAAVSPDMARVLPSEKPPR
ncbi:LysR family transcriptional regulator [Myxococcus stipitatus]|uniref:LysR family transcriptional regulator n=1 Tax=Myxococcus stipitatus TaxID=83455 RepID=UPI001F47B62F|nr:LysR family transcriptional regulator [Myxococcus stipitatus]MCE9672557.1 LysR family transcriptional regulator [Myxococcus stipitatus]